MTSSETAAYALVHAYLKGRTMDEHLLEAAVSAAESRLCAGVSPILSDLLRQDIDNQVGAPAATLRNWDTRRRSKSMTKAEWAAKWKSDCQQLSGVSGVSDSATIYVIDDDPSMRDAIATIIRRLRPDAQIEELSCVGEVPLGAGSRLPPMAVVLDLNVPDAQGCFGVLHIRKNYPQTLLAVCSASPASEMALKCVAAGADLYIHKGTGSQKLTVALSALLLMGSSPALDVEGNAPLGVPAGTSANA